MKRGVMDPVQVVASVVAGLIALAVVLISPLRGGRGEVRNVTRAVRDARRMRSLPARTVD